MKITLSVVSIFSLSLFLNAQVGIGTDDPHISTILDIDTSNKGVLLPNIALESRTDKNSIEDVVDGIMVYNTTTLAGNEETKLEPGIYYWLTDKWVSNKRGELVEVTTNGKIRSFLGYEANGVRNANSFSLNGINFARGGNETSGFGCKRWDVNGHWYCAFRGNTGFNWETAYNAAKSKGGYLVTFTSLAEWQWVKTNLIQSGTGYNLTNSIWIGYNKVNFSGNPTEFTWITGEKSKVLWGNTTITEHFFNTDEPNNQGGNEGCAHIISSAQNSERRWNDIECHSSNTEWSGPWRDLIIEFEQ